MGREMDEEMGPDKAEAEEQVLVLSGLRKREKLLAAPPVSSLRDLPSPAESH